MDGPKPLTATPTPDDGARRSTQQLLDETERPTGPPPDPGRTYTPSEQAAGQHLIDVHDMLRRELDELHEVIEQLKQGELDASAVRSHLDQMTIRQNAWTLGVICLRYCRAVAGHHTLEDISVFPHLESRDPKLKPVLRCLAREHEVISNALDVIDARLVALAAGEADALLGVQEAVDALSDALISHLSYEERELIEPLARHGFH
jgi:hemerythrin-like domain-containing protein